MLFKIFHSSVTFKILNLHHVGGIKGGKKKGMVIIGLCSAAGESSFTKPIFILALNVHVGNTVALSKATTSACFFHKIISCINLKLSVLTSMTSYMTYKVKI